MSLLDWFRVRHSEIERVHADAAELRERYGDEAEHWCTAGLLSAREASKRRRLKQIQKALKHIH